MNKIVSIIRWLLLPVSLIYWLVTLVRNTFYDLGVFTSTQFKVPVISVGNITVGGTGKTPHVEWLISVFGENGTVVLSRGYGRKTKGYLELDSHNLNPESYGDEPVQIKTKFPAIGVHVCEKRAEGINNITQKHPDTRLIILDDAFQHRAVKPSLSLVLVDYHRPVYNDFTMPSGNLREPHNGLRRADIVIVTKCPDSLSQRQQQTIKQKLKFDTAKIFFSTFVYGAFTPVFHRSKLLFRPENIFLITGIANPAPLLNHLTGYRITHFKYADHYSFSTNDILKVMQAFMKEKNDKKIILTTEKDAMRLQSFKSMLQPVAPWLYYLPVKVRVLNNEPELINLLKLRQAKNAH